MLGEAVGTALSRKMVPPPDDEEGEEELMGPSMYR